MTERDSGGLILRRIEPTEFQRPGKVLYDHLHGWIAEGLTAEQMLSRVSDQTGQAISVADTTALTGWIHEERALAEGYQQRNQSDQAANVATDHTRPIDDIAAARVAMIAAGIIQPNEPAQGEQ